MALAAVLTGPAGAAERLPPGRYAMELVVATFARAFRVALSLPR